ncbi:hypothetical protein [Chitinophaga sp. ARDCPP14]
MKRLIFLSVHLFVLVYSCVPAIRKHPYTSASFVHITLPAIR